MIFDSKIIVNKVHTKVLGYPASEKTHTFISNLSSSTVGLFTTSAISYLIGILAGRFLGVSQFGIYNLIISTGQVIISISLFGLDTSSVYFTSKNKKENFEKHISAHLLVLTLNLLISFFTIEVIRSVFPTIFNKVATLLPFIFLYVIVYSYKSVFDGVLRGLGSFKKQTILRSAEILTSLFLISFFLLQFSNYTYTKHFITIISGQIALLITFFIVFRNKFVVPPFNTIKSVYMYTSTIAIGGIFGNIISQIDKLFVARFLGIDALGIYSGYLTATSFITLNLIAAFINVFLPSVINHENKKALFHKINKLASIFLPITFIFIFIASTIILKFLGHEYSLDILLLTFFCLIATLQVLLTINYSILLSAGNNIFSKYVRASIITGIIYTLSFIILVYTNKYSLTSTTLNLLAYIIVQIIIQILIITNHLPSFDVKSKHLVGKTND